MSSIATGNILAAPVGGIVVAGAAVAVTALAAVAIAGAGVIVVREGGRAVMACGQELQVMAKENRRLQRALHDAARRYESQLRDKAATLDLQHIAQLRTQLEEQRRQQQQREQFLAAVQNRLQAASRQQEIDRGAVQTLCDQLLAADPPASGVRLERLAGWANKVHQAIVLAEQLGLLLQRFTTGPYQGLFKTQFLQDLHQETLQQLRGLEAEADLVSAQNPPDVGTYQQVLAALSYLDRRMKEMDLLVPDRFQQRQNAWATIEQARQMLDRMFTANVTQNELAGLQIAAQTIDDALTTMDTLEFSKAQGIAEAAQQHLQTVTDVTAQQRHHNLSLFLHRLHQQVAPLRSLEALQKQVDLWLEHYRQVADLPPQQVEAAWTLLGGDGGLASRAEQLQQQALQILLWQSGQSLAALSQNTLEAMGYQVETLPTEADTQLLLGRQGQRRFYVTLSEMGSMSLRAEGFGNTSCKPEMEDFLRRMKEHGTVGVWQQQFSLTESVQRLSHMLQEAGLNVKIEPSENGATVLASGTVGTARVSYDGTTSFSPEMNQLYREWIEQVRSLNGTTAKQDEALSRLDTLDEEWARQQQLAQEQQQSMMLREYR